MQGSLGLFNLVDLLQLLGSNKANGVLVVHHPTLGDVRVFFGEGNITHVASRVAQDVAALQAVLRHEEGRFEFVPNREPPKQSITAPLDQILFQAIRDLGATNEDKGPIPPDDDAIPMVLDVTRLGTLTMSEQDLVLVSAVDGESSILEIAEDTEQSLDAVRDLLMRLASLGIVSLKKPEPRVARLVVGLSRDISGLTAYLDEKIMNTWKRQHRGEIVAARLRLASGKECLVRITSAPEIGPYLLLSSSGLLRYDLRAGTSVLVKPDTRPVVKPDQSTARPFA